MSDNLSEPTFDIEAARKVLEAERQDRLRRAGRRIDDVLKEERCSLVVAPAIIIDGKPAQVALLAQE